MKNARKSRHDTSHPIVKEWALTLLSATVITCMTSAASHASDLEIYQAPTQGSVVVTMMLDNSGSMNERSIGADYSDRFSVNFANNGRYYCNVNGIYLTNAVQTETKTQIVHDNNGLPTTTSKSYSVNYCQSGTTKYYDRISRLKMALMPMFANPKSDQGFGSDADISKYKIGLGSFFFRSSDEGGGKIDSPAVALTLDNRQVFLDKIIALRPETNTPLANAYAEAGAYMLGTKTYTQRFEEANYLVGYSFSVRRGRNTKYYLYKCEEYQSTKTNYNGYEYYDCRSDSDYDRLQNNSNNLETSRLGGFDQQYDINGRTYYFQKRNSQIQNDKWSGFSLSVDSSKKLPDKTRYESPISSTTAQCDAHGIFMLTDGEPNNSFTEQSTLGLMNNSLSGGSVSMGSSCNSNLLSAGSVFASSAGNRPAWECIGEYSQSLINVGNPKKIPIRTAVVGFGSVYKTIENADKITKIYEGKPISVYNCDATGVSKDASNLCKLGEKAYGYGDGGSFFTSDSVGVSNSLKTFVRGLGNNVIEPISTGTMSVPLDSLGGLKSRGFAYLPILEPVPKSPLLWNGNLKKYKVKDATLVGADNNPVFTSEEGEFAKNTHDLWNTLSGALRPDQAKPQVGGAYQKVFENAIPPAIGNRNLFVDSGGALVNLTVSADKKPNNFGKPNTTPNPLPNYTNDQKITLLNFMGYGVPANTTVEDGKDLATTQNKSLKNIGGVLHSVPQLITQKVNVDASGKFNLSSRKDYVLYGSMDGALHMLDDSTGEETFTFIPKQILDLQPAAITGNGTAKDGSYPYGVDAPWLTYASYTVKSTTEGSGATAQTTNSYEAAQSFALGGLRMGGSMYYALDVSNPKAPKMIYSVGSNYANRLKGLTTDVSGVKNGNSAITSAATATADQKAYARMGQTWGKPTLGYVKSGGKKVMVSFLPGGYDACYEDPKFKLATTVNTSVACSKTAAQGNAMYMVQVGEVETDATSKEETVKTSADNGKLLWWASNDGTSTTSRSPSLQYSKAADLKHSVVTQVRALDRNYDGLIDHIYFADLGGQVWRADINNNEDTANFKVDRVVKILDVSDQVTGDDAPPRIYERPLITFHNGTHTYRDDDNKTGQYSGVQAIVTVGTGDRSNPVTATRNKPNALYSVLDKDVSRNELFHYGTDTAPTLNLRTPITKVAGGSARNDNLQQLTFTNADLGTSGIRTRMQNNTIQGWYMPLTHWLDQDAVTGGKYKLKMFNEPDAIAGVLISSSFNPDEGQDPNACSAGVIGETQRERTCLPYGVCLDSTKSEILTPRSSYSAGLGIVDNIVSQYNDTPTFTSLKNYCEGDDCKPEVICTGDDCSDVNQCVGPDCGPDAGINVDQRINPLSWMEN
ncbi:pilus assembly protein [Psychrobacter aquaticus]|uniref:Type IV fimbrial biogenesis protein PilY1 n=1 Tax=Psychrobacter aquaticus CMS 56 TaxID=1354303 RepID=U4T2Q4_9GAMM|nr:PilC/PilY family type IV pilus protein [Psychrobacter aquaticus]ERL55322.1 Type IV fimbrial biogenesis protein PilY1 [Psychrobacter aquaticus CMS 56]